MHCDGRPIYSPVYLSFVYSVSRMMVRTLHGLCSVLIYVAMYVAYAILYTVCFSLGHHRKACVRYQNTGWSIVNPLPVVRDRVVRKAVSQTKKIRPHLKRASGLATVPLDRHITRPRSYHTTMLLHSTHLLTSAHLAPPTHTSVAFCRPD